MVETPEQFSRYQAGPVLLQLPTLYLTDVTGVRDVTDPDNVIIIDDYRTEPTKNFRAGLLSRRNCRWPLGAIIEVDIVHGYPAWPDDLLIAVAAVAQDLKVNKATGTVRVGAVSITPNGAAVEDGISRAINRYKIPLVP